MAQADVSSLTLEGFFLTDYERLRNRCEVLEQQLAQMSNGGYGVRDLQTPTEAVKVEVMTSYYMRQGEYRGLDLKELNRAYAMDKDDLRKWSETLFRSNTYYEPARPIKIHRHKFQYTLEVNETRGSFIAATDGEKGSPLLDIDTMEDDMRDNLSKWCRDTYEEQLIDAALQELRDNLGAAIEELGKKED